MNHLLNQLLKLEEQLIIRFAQNERKTINPIEPFSDKEIENINKNLHLTSDENIAFKAHKVIVSSLIYKYLYGLYPNSIDLFENLFSFEKDDERFDGILLIDIPHLLEDFHVVFLNSQFLIKQNQLRRIKSKHYLKEYGAVYTHSSITREIVSVSVKNAINTDGVDDLRCLDFACGTGRFYFEAIHILQKEYNLSLKDIICKHLFAIDIDEVALSILRLKVVSMLDNIDREIAEALTTNILYRNGLIPNTTLLSEFNNCIDLQIDFQTAISNGGFNAIFSNPPYYLLKANKDNDLSKVDHFKILQNKIKREITFFKNSNFYHYSIEGMLNYYKLSIEMILNLTKPKGQIGIICPASIFGDMSSSKLRKHLLSNNKLKFIRYYPEKADLFNNIAQSTVIFYLEKGGITDNVEIEFKEDLFTISYATILSLFRKNLEIPLIDKIGWNILLKLNKHQRLKNISFLRNRRGELDLSLYKDCIMKDQRSDYRLVRGNMISINGIVDKNNECVDIDVFLNKKSDDYKSNDFNKKRLICQQISNIDLEKRLRFVYSNEKDIIGNSCNYITSLRSSEDLDKLFYLLNSKLLNWRFKVTSSNNHVNNYELDDLPIIDLESIHVDMFNKDIDENEIIICRLYGLNQEEINYILQK